MHVIQQYKWFFIAIVIIGILFLINPSQGIAATKFTLNNLKSVSMVLPPIFILIGLMDVWIPKETMVKFMGHRSGVKGAIIAIVIGAMGAGPLYVAFPVAALLIKKGARLAYAFLLLGAWTSVKLPIFMFEWASFGPSFTLTHVLSSLIIYIVGSFLMEQLLSEKTKKKIYINIEDRLGEMA